MSQVDDAKTTMSALRSAKRALRKTMAERLAHITPTDLAAQSRLVTSRILSSPTYRQARNISIYVSTDTGEVDTDALCRSTLQDTSKRLYVPLFASAVAGGTASAANATFAADMRMLQLRSLAEYEGLKRNRWGIREPEAWIETEARARPDALDAQSGGQGLDLILAPGVAFDVEAGRLGHGKGYYDRYLSQAEAWAEQNGGAKGPVCVALGLTQQVLPDTERVPTDDNDRTLDAIITPQGVLRGRADRGRWQDGRDEQGDMQ